MTKNPKRPRDPNQLGKLIADIATGDAENVRPKAPDARKRKGGLKGGKARAMSLSPQERRDVAQKGAYSRWGKKQS